jgi:hypothetical protein
MNNDEALGNKVWAFAAGHIPFLTNGAEPAFTSRDQIAILNTGKHVVKIVIKIMYEDQQEVGDYRIIVQGKRLRKIRFNDLIDPLPVPLDKPYGFLLVSSGNVIVQFSRINTGASACALMGTTAYHQ